MIFFVSCLAVENIHVQVTQNVLKTGFHRDLQVNIDFLENNLQNCNISILTRFPQGVYLSVNEIRDRIAYLTARGKNSFRVDYFGKEFDIEKPAFQSPEHEVLFEMLIEDKSLTFSYPFHFRYQLPGQDEFRSVETPEIIMITSRCETPTKREYLLQYDTIVPVMVNIPVGMAQDADFVAYITVFVSFSSSIILLWFLGCNYR